MTDSAISSSSDLEKDNWENIGHFCGCEDKECYPISSIRGLLDFVVKPAQWCELVEPITPRSKSRHLGDNYQIIDFNKLDIDFVDNDKRPQVLLCHDFKGNYLNDKYINGAPNGKWDDYRFYNWAAIDIFCYFSHNFITIPTLQWINCAHRNGVKVIGTLIIEGQNSRLLPDILQSEEFMKKIADALVFISKYCKFDGWLLNVECTLAEEKIPMLIDFVKYLTEKSHHELPGSVIIWYDSITEKGLLHWQNELNTLNHSFFGACDGIFLNYGWTAKNLDRCNNFIESYYPERKLDVYVGIDVFGRGQKAQLSSYLTMAQIVNYGFSTAIFAPGWTLESLEHSMQLDSLNDYQCNTRFMRRNDKFWNSLWKYFHVMGPAVLPFSTSFCLGSGKIRNRLGKLQGHSWFDLAKQQFQPSIPATPPTEYEENVGPVYWRHCFDTSLNGGSCLKLQEQIPNTRLFVCNFDVQHGIILSYAIKRKNISSTFNLILNVVNADLSANKKVVCGDETYEVEGFGEIAAKMLDKNDAINVAKHLGATLKLPLGANVINEWEIRYYYLSFLNIPNSQIIDIGLEMKKNSDSADSFVLLGAISMHKGDIVLDREISNVSEIKF